MGRHWRGESVRGLGTRRVRMQSRLRALGRDVSCHRAECVAHMCVYNRLQTGAEINIWKVYYIHMPPGITD